MVAIIGNINIYFVLIGVFKNGRIIYASVLDSSSFRIIGCELLLDIASMVGINNIINTRHQLRIG